MSKKAASFLLLLLVQVAILTAQAPTRATPAKVAGGAASIDGLRDAYLTATQEHSAEKLEPLFLWTGVPASLHQVFAHDLLVPNQAIASSRIRNVDPSTLADYKRFHHHFNAPVLKVLEIHTLPAKGDDGSIETDLYIGQSEGRFYFLTAVADDDAGQPRHQ